MSLKVTCLAKEGEPPASQIALQCVSALGRALILGPLGSSVSLVWERDEALIIANGDADDTIEVKKTQ